MINSWTISPTEGELSGPELTARLSYLSDALERIAFDPFVIAETVGGPDAAIEDFTVRWASRLACDYVGIDPAVAPGQRLTTFVANSPVDVIGQLRALMLHGGDLSLEDFSTDPSTGNPRMFNLRGFSDGNCVIISWRDASDPVVLAHRFPTLVEQLVDVIVVERQGRIVWVSPAVSHLLQLDAGQVLGRSVSELMVVDDRAAFSWVERDLPSGGVGSITVRFVTSSGDPKWVAMQVRDVTGVDGGETERIHVWRDADEQVETKRALASAESRYRLVVEDASDLILECDDGGTVRWASPSAARLIGSSDVDLVGRHIVDLIEADDVVKAERQLRQAMTDFATPFIELRFQTASGESRWMSQRVHLVRNAEEKSDMLVVVARPIDEQVLTRHAGNDAERRLQLLTRHMGEVVFSTDGANMIEWMSPSVQRVLKWNPAELLGTNALDLVHPAEVEKGRAMQNLVLLGENIEIGQIRFRDRDGDYKWMTLRAAPRPDEQGKVQGLVVTLTDCDRQVVVERGLRTLSAAGRVLVRARTELDLLRQMCEVAVADGGYQLAWYARKNNDEERSITKVAWSAGHEGYVVGVTITWGDGEDGQGPTGRALRSGRTATSTDFAGDAKFRPWSAAATAQGLSSSSAIPVWVDGIVDGSIQIYAAETNAFQPMALTTLEDLAAEMGYGLEQLRRTATVRGFTAK